MNGLILSTFDTNDDRLWAVSQVLNIEVEVEYKYHLYFHYHNLAIYEGSQAEWCDEDFFCSKMVAPEELC